MAHGTATNSIELSGDAKSFDRVARKWNVDYAFYKTGPDKYLLFFKAGQADAMTACFSEYSRKVLSKAKSNRVPDVYKRQCIQGLYHRFRHTCHIHFFFHYLSPSTAFLTSSTHSAL